MSKENSLSNPNTRPRQLIKRFGSLAGGLALSAAVVSGCESSSVEPSDSYSEYTAEPGDNLTTVAESYLDKCDEGYDDFDTQNAISRIVTDSDKNTNDLGIGEVLEIDDDLCKIILGE